MYILRRFQSAVMLFLLTLAYQILAADYAESRMREALFQKYDKLSRPLANWTETLHVSLEFSPLYLNGLNGAKQSFSMYGWLAIKWQDQRLSWNPDEYGGIEYFITHPSTIWTPDLGIINSVSHLYGDILDLAEYRGKVTSSGLVRIVTAGTVETTCILDVTYFPFDEQVCHIEIDSWTEPSPQLILSAENAVLTMSRLRPNEQWRVVKDWIHVENTSVYVPELGNSHYQTISFVFRIRRKSMYVGANFLLPCVGVVAMELIVFGLPPNSGEKISLAITLFLAQTVYQLIMQGDMPKSSDSVPLINLYILISMVISGLIILSSTVVLSIHYHKQGQGKTWWVGHLAHTHVGSRSNDEHKKSKEQRLQGKWLNSKSAIGKLAEKDSYDPPANPDVKLWEEFAHILDRVFFYIYFTFVAMSTLTFLLIISLAQQPVMAPKAGYGYTYKGERT